MRIKVLLLSTCLLLTGCRHKDARAAWDDVIKNCAVSDLNAKTVLYFGPSNSVGPGSVWRPGPDGGFHLRWSLNEMPNHDVFINAGIPSTCNGTKTTKFGLSAALGLSSKVTPASVDLSNDLKMAKNIEVKASSVAWDLIKEGPFETYIKSLPVLGSVREDLGKGDRLVLYRALRVGGFSAKLEFSAEDAATLKGKYSGPLPQNLTGDLGVNLSANWDNASTLTLESAGEFYIAGELSPYSATGFAGAGSAFGKRLEIKESATVTREKIQ